MYAQLAATSLLIAVLAGCNSMRPGADGPGAEDFDDTTTTEGAPAGGDTAGMAGGAGGAGAGAAEGTPDITPEMVSMGDRVYHGRVANAICYSCHGQDGKGTDTAPSLADSEWLNIDGSFESIVQVVREGVPTPKEHSGPMPPMGGTRLSDEQLQAVSAYVYSLTHPEVAGAR